MTSSKSTRILLWLVAAGLVAFVGMQLVRPELNESSGDGGDSGSAGGEGGAAE